MKYFLCILCALLLFQSCAYDIVTNKNDKKNNLTASYELLQIGEKRFLLDDESQPRNRCIQLYEDIKTDSLYYTFYNEYNNSIYVYDYLSSNLIKKIQFDKEGSDGVYPYRSGYYISSFDSIYFRSMSTNRLYVLNESGMKYQTINLRADLNHNVIPPTIKITTETPIYKIGNVLYLCGSINEEIEDLDSIYGLLVTKISSHDDFSNPVLNIGYPSSYRKGNWGDAYFRNVCWCYNSKEHAFYLSFANDHYIYKYDKSMEMVDKIYAGSAFADDICSIDHPQNIPLPKSKRIAHYLSSFYYRGIIYDKYNDVYYRILEHPWENFNPNERPWKKPISIAVFNSDFKYLGEKLLSEEYNLSADNIFVSKEGLFIRKETDCEDELIYSIFRLNKIY